MPTDLSEAAQARRGRPLTSQHLVCPLVSAPDPVLLLHGQPGGASDWDPVVAEIRGRCDTLAIDRPGYDGHSPPGGIAHSAHAALGELDEAGIERTTLVGVSFGGAVAAWLAAHHPERVGALLLVSPAANPESLLPVDRMLAAPFIGPATSAGLLFSAGLLTLAHPVRQQLARAWGISEPHLRRTGTRLLHRETINAFVVEQRSLFDELPALGAELGSIVAPTTIVIGTRDTIVPPAANHRLAQQIPGSRVVEIEGARHSLCVTHPHEIAELIVEIAGAQPGEPALSRP